MQNTVQYVKSLDGELSPDRNSNKSQKVESKTHDELIATAHAMRNVVINRYSDKVARVDDYPAVKNNKSKVNRKLIFDSKNS